MRPIKVKYAGDAERRREAQREATRQWIRKGMRVTCALFGPGVVLRVNKKTATIGETGASGTLKTPVDLSWLAPLGPKTSASA